MLDTAKLAEQVNTSLRLLIEWPGVRHPIAVLGKSNQLVVLGVK